MGKLVPARDAPERHLQASLAVGDSSVNLNLGLHLAELVAFTGNAAAPLEQEWAEGALAGVADELVDTVVEAWLLAHVEARAECGSDARHLSSAITTIISPHSLRNKHP